MLPDKDNDELLNDLRQKLANQSSLEYEEKRNELNVSKNVFVGAVSGEAEYESHLAGFPLEGWNAECTTCNTGCK